MKLGEEGKKIKKTPRGRAANWLYFDLVSSPPQQKKNIFF